MGEYGHVHQTFEEFASQHLDGLYHGALFLNGGAEPPAEDLVLWTLTGAFQEFRDIEERSAPKEWLEGKLVERFLARTPQGSTDDVVSNVSGDDLSHEPSPGGVEIDHEALMRAGAKLPPLARAAIWLVVFRRWSYAEASIVLDTGLDALKGLLRYRQVLLTAAVRGPLDRNGTDRDRRY